MPEVENQEAIKHISYFDKFCAFCCRFYRQILQVTGSTAIVTSVLSYNGFDLNDALLSIPALLLAFLCIVTAFITIFVLCALWRGTVMRESANTEIENNELNVMHTTVQSFCYKWCSRLLTVIGACCVCLALLWVLCIPSLMIWPIQHSFGDNPPFLLFLIGLGLMYYFCLFSAIPVLFTAVLKLLDRH